MRNLFADGKFKRNFFGFEQNFVNFLFRVIGKRKQMFFFDRADGRKFVYVHKDSEASVF